MHLRQRSCALLLGLVVWAGCRSECLVPMVNSLYIAVVPPPLHQVTDV